MGKQTVEPQYGQTFRAAYELELEGEKRKRLLCLLAAYADAGEASPPMFLLSEQLELAPQQIDGLLDRLERDGYLTVRWACGQRRETTKPGRYRTGKRFGPRGQRNVYALHLNGARHGT